LNARVSIGGLDIPESDIRRRYEHTRLNLIELLPQLAALRVFDNSHEAYPAAGQTPKPVIVLEMKRGKILNPRDLPGTPNWTKPIVAAAIKLSSG
jgi:predicted ABC-type ATPase